MNALTRFKYPILLVVVGVGLNVLATSFLLGTLRNPGIPIMAPGETAVTIAKPGDYTLWQETRTVIDGQLMTFAEELPPGVAIQVVKVPEGVPVPLRSDGSTTVESGGVRRVSVCKISFSAPGDYRVIIAGFGEKRAFRLDDIRFLPAFLKTLVPALFGILFLLAGLGLGISVLVGQRTASVRGVGS